MKFAATGLMPARKKKRDLIFLTELIEAREIKAVIDRVYPLEQIAEAHRYVEKDIKRGMSSSRWSIMTKPSKTRRKRKCQKQVP